MVNDSHFGTLSTSKLHCRRRVGEPKKFTHFLRTEYARDANLQGKNRPSTAITATTLYGCSAARFSITDRTKKTNATFRDPELFAISGRVGELTQPIVHLLVQVSAGRVAGMKGRSPHNLCPKLVCTRARDKNEPYFASTLCSSRGRSGPLPDSLSSLALFLRGMTLTRDKRRALSLPASVLLHAIFAKIHGKYRNCVQAYKMKLCFMFHHFMPCDEVIHIDHPLMNAWTLRCLGVS